MTGCEQMDADFSRGWVLVAAAYRGESVWFDSEVEFFLTQAEANSKADEYEGHGYAVRVYAPSPSRAAVSAR